MVFALSTHLKQLSSRDVPAAHTLRPGAVRSLVAATVRHRLWLAGIVCDTVGLALQVVALHLGPLSAVQAVLVVALVFALLLRQLQQRRFSSRETGWAVVVTGALAGLIILARTQADLTAGIDAGPAIGAGVVLAALTAGSAVLGRRQQAGTRVALALGATVGAIYATTAALLKQLSNLGVHHPLSVLTSWPLYVLIPLGAGGLVLSQVAFRAGPLSASLPTMSVVDPLLSIVLGIWVFDERVHAGARAGIGLGALLVMLVVGVIWLARDNAVGEHCSA